MIKKFLTAIVALLFVTAMQAQSFNAQKTANELASAYSLDDAQKTEMLIIQQRKARNLTEIQSLKSTDRPTYIKKLKAIRYGTDASIKRLLNKEQMEVFFAKSKERRQKEADVMSEMKAAGATQEEIQEALAQID